MNPMVSVIMPIYNAEQYIRQAIESILGQSYPDFELIMIDDCPTDSTMEIARKYKDDRIRIVHNDRNRGIAYSRNKGLDHSKGKYIAIMDNDDISSSDRLEKEVDFLESHPDIGIVAGGVQIIDEEGKVIAQSSRVLHNPRFLKAVFLFKNVFWNSEVMFRKDMIDRNHIRYRENCLGMEDFRFWIECSKVIAMSGIDDMVLQYRKREDSEGGRLKRGNGQKRAEKWAELQKFSLQESGFQLEVEQFAFLSRLCYGIDERKHRDWNDFLNLYYILSLIVKQSEDRQVDYREEIRTACHRIMIQMLNNTERLFL